jgi:serine/threonine protein kinase
LGSLVPPKFTPILNDDRFTLKSSSKLQILKAAPFVGPQFLNAKTANLEMTESRPSSETPLHSGWATKLGGVFKTWKRRWFVLTPGYLSYYAKEGGELIKRFDIRDANIDAYPKSKRSFAFSIITSKRTLEISADNEADRQAWLSKLQSHIKTEKMKVDLDSFDIMKLLGQGAYGKVRMVQLKTTKQIFALKSMSKRKLAEFDLAERTIAERDIMLQLNHPFIVALRSTFQTETKVFMVMDYIGGGELLSRIKQEGVLSEDCVRLYAAELVLGIEYLHKEKVIHRDLKAENILIDDKGHVRITDFGLVKKLESGTQKATTFCGTSEYMAPEIITDHPYTEVVDWWALGILIFQMLFGQVPFSDRNPTKVYRMICREEIIFPHSASEAARELISGLCTKDPGSRLGGPPRGAADIKAMAFFEGIDWDAVSRRALTMPWIPQWNATQDGSMFQVTVGETGPSLVGEAPDALIESIEDQLVGFTAVNERMVDQKLG